MSKKIKVLIACEESGIVRREFADKGFYVVSCDLLDTDIPCKYPWEFHYKGDVMDIINDTSWDLMIAHPVCTRLCNSGVMWLKKRNLWGDLKKSALFFKKLLEANIKYIAIENPIPHKYAVEIIGRKYDQIIQPWMFGHGETKATCFWLKGLPKLKPTNIVEEREQRLHRLPPSKDRAKLRSRTYPGIAKAMVEQWGDFVLTKEAKRGKENVKRN